MLGPLFNSTCEPSCGGATSIMVLINSFSGYSNRGYFMSYNFSRSLGSVILPVKTEAAAVSGLQRYTWSSSVPERLGKLRGIVLRLMLSDAGACPIPMQPIHPD